MNQIHSHDHQHSTQGSQTKMGAAVVLTLILVACEAVAGYLASSLALLSDAGHNLADAAALGLSWYALWISHKPAHAGMTYGYHRVSILAALVNAVALVVIALAIVWEAFSRLRHPEIVHGAVMIVVALIGIAINVLIGAWLHASAKHDLNVRSAYIHMIGDAASAAGVVIAGIVVISSGFYLADPLISFVIAALILYSSWGVLKESVFVLLEGTPAGLDMNAVAKAIISVSGVMAVHDLHVWTVGPGAIACSCHIQVSDQTIRDGQEIVGSVGTVLCGDFGINHTTVQIEVHDNSVNRLYCTMKKSDDAC